MKKRILYPMGSYRNKIAGLIIILISLIMLLIVIIHGPLSFLHNAHVHIHLHQFNFFLATLIFGMHMTAFSKEKQDDERVQAIRTKALQMALGLLTGTIAAFSLAISIASKSIDNIDLTTVSFIAAYGLAVYLIVFHVGLYFEPSWTYNNDNT